MEIDSLAGKVVLITGGGRGIGHDIAVACAKKNASVIVAARSSSELENTLKELRNITDSPCLAIQCDVAKPAEMPKLLNAIEQMGEKTGGKLDGLICAAGIYGAIGSFSDIPFEKWQQAIEINLLGTARTIHTLIPALKMSTDSRVILFSGGGQGPMPQFSAYVTSKGGIWRLTETLGAELAKHHIYLNAIAPGAVNTKLLDELLEAGPDRVGQSFYEKSLQQKKEGGTPSTKAVELTLYLLSAKSKGLFGKTLSAVWDPYQEFKSLEALSRSDVYTMRRVIDHEGKTR